MAIVGYPKGNTNKLQMEVLLANINNKALGRISFDSLNNICYGEFKIGIENSSAKGANICPPNETDKLMRAQNYTVPKNPLVRNRDALVFTTTNGKNGGGANNHGRGST